MHARSYLSIDDLVKMFELSIISYIRIYGNSIRMRKENKREPLVEEDGEIKLGESLLSSFLDQL